MTNRTGRVTCSASWYAATVARPQASHVNARSHGGARRVAELAPPGGVLEQPPDLGGERLGIAGRDEPDPTAARGDLLRPGLAAAADRGHPGRHRLDVGDAERLVDAREREDGGLLPDLSGRQLTLEVDAAARGRALAAIRSSAGRSGPSPTTTQRRSGWSSRSSHSARRTSAWRLRATRWPTVRTVGRVGFAASAAAARRCRGARRGCSPAPSSRAFASVPCELARTMVAFCSAFVTVSRPPGRCTTESTSPPWTETTTGVVGARPPHRIAGGRGVVGVDEVEREAAVEPPQREREARSRPRAPVLVGPRPRRRDERHVGDRDAVELGVERLAERLEELARARGRPARRGSARGGAARARARRRRRRARRAPGDAPTRRARGPRRAGSTRRRRPRARGGG